MIFDTHAHYDDEAFDDDREELLAGLAAAGVELVVNSDQQEATTLAFNPTTGLFNGNHSFSRTWDASTAAGKAGASFSVIAFLEAYPKVVSAVIRAYDAEGEKLYERTFDNLTLKRATKLVVSTNLFTGSIAPSLSFEEWSVEN